MPAQGATDPEPAALIIETFPWLEGAFEVEENEPVRFSDRVNFLAKSVFHSLVLFL